MIDLTKLEDIAHTLDAIPFPRAAQTVREALSEITSLRKRVEEHRERIVEQWHLAPDVDVPLQTVLGMTDEEYAVWAVPGCAWAPVPPPQGEAPGDGK